MERICGDCSICCEGWLFATVNGYNIYPGRPCQFMNKGCTIYDERPDFPCRAFKCDWLENNDIPEWLQPNLSKVILSTHRWGENNDKIFLRATECGKKMDSAVLCWLFEYHLRTNIPLAVQVNGGWTHFGEEFKEFILKDEDGGDVPIESRNTQYD